MKNQDQILLEQAYSEIHSKRLEDADLQREQWWRKDKKKSDVKYEKLPPIADKPINTDDQDNDAPPNNNRYYLKIPGPPKPPSGTHAASERDARIKDKLPDWEPKKTDSKSPSSDASQELTARVTAPQRDIRKEIMQAAADLEDAKEARINAPAGTPEAKAAFDAVDAAKLKLDRLKNSDEARSYLKKNSRASVEVKSDQQPETPKPKPRSRKRVKRGRKWVWVDR